MNQRVTPGWIAALCIAMTATGGFTADVQQPGRRRSLIALQTEVQSLRVEKVAWRKIEWKTCLLAGLRASCEQQKPLMLWIFIDRPIDDERC